MIEFLLGVARVRWPFCLIPIGFRIFREVRREHQRIMEWEMLPFMSPESGPWTFLGRVLIIVSFGAASYLMGRGARSLWSRLRSNWA